MSEQGVFLLTSSHARELFQALDVGGEGSLSVKEACICSINLGTGQLDFQHK